MPKDLSEQSHAPDTSSFPRIDTTRQQFLQQRKQELHQRQTTIEGQDQALIQYWEKHCEAVEKKLDTFDRDLAVLNKQIDNLTYVYPLGQNPLGNIDNQEQALQEIDGYRADLIAKKNLYESSPEFQTYTEKRARVDAWQAKQESDQEDLDRDRGHFLTETSLRNCSPVPRIPKKRSFF